MIKIIGVGGGGNNAVNYMYNQGIQDVDFIVCNTDKQILDRLDIPTKIQLGPELTKGLGAGGNPEIGRKAAEESKDELRKILDPSPNETEKGMAFITAGMGGGTGTGAAPIIAEICKKIGMLTIGVVTTPFNHEGKPRLKKAEEGIKQLKQHVDTLIVINNDKLKHHYGKLDVFTALDKANEVLSIGTQSITSIINECGLINVDFADIKTVLKNGGVALIGQATLSSQERHDLVATALASPLLNNNDISGAKKILINICIPDRELSPDLEEIENIMQEIRNAAGLSDVDEDDETDIFYGISSNSALENKIMLTIIATGFQQKDLSNHKKPIKTVLELTEKNIPEPNVETIQEETTNKKEQATPTSEDTDTQNPPNNSKEETPHNEPPITNDAEEDPFAFSIHTKNDPINTEENNEDFTPYIERGAVERAERNNKADQKRRKEQLGPYNMVIPDLDFEKTTHLDLDFDNPDSKAYENELVKKMRQNQYPQKLSSLHPDELSNTILKKDNNGNITITKGNKYIDGNHPD